MEANRLRFRAWDKHYKYMMNNIIVDAGPIDEETGEEYAGEIQLRECPHYGVHVGGHYCRPLDCVIVMQSTGLLDKNGKEIYESDIVEHISKNICNGKYGEVVWALGEWSLLDNEGALDMPIFGNNESLIVAGNVYENSEMVNEK